MPGPRLYLFLPIFVIVLYSFNKPAGKFNFVWKAFSLDTWATRSRTTRWSRR